MSQTLRDKLAEAEAQVEHLKARIGATTCAEAGHVWEFAGGKNAGCDDGCRCSVSVNKCAVCGDYDYGDNAEAAQIIADCRELHAND